MSSKQEEEEIKFRDLNCPLSGNSTGSSSGLKYASMKRFKGDWVYGISEQEVKDQNKCFSFFVLFVIITIIAMSL